MAILLTGAVICLVGAFVQVVMTRRTLLRVSAWLADAPVSLSLSQFGRWNVYVTVAWAVAAVIAAYVIIDSRVLVGRNAELEVASFSAAVLCWCALHGLLSLLSFQLASHTTRLAAARGLMPPPGESPVESLLPEPLQDFSARQTPLERTLATLRWSTGILYVLHAVIALGLVMALITRIPGAEHSLPLQLVVLAVSLLLPTVSVLMFLRKMVEARAKQAQFLWFLATTVQKQRPLAAELLGWGESNPGRFGRRAVAAARLMTEGASLAVSLRGHGLLSDNDILTIRVSEQTGRLAETLRDLAARRTHSLRGDPYNDAAIGLVLYLWMLLTVGSSIVGYLMYNIVPKYKAIFMGFGTELPGVTILLINLADFAVRYGVVFVLFIPLTVVLIRTVIEAYYHGWSETNAAWWLGFTRRAEIPRLLRRLRDAVLGQVPWPTALLPLVVEHHRADIRQRLERVLGRVTAGRELFPALRDAGLLSNREVGLLELAERANNLDWALAALADSKERRTAHVWRVIQTALIPACVVAGGLFVGFIVVGFFLPLVKLLNDLS